MLKMESELIYDDGDAWLVPLEVMQLPHVPSYERQPPEHALLLRVHQPKREYPVSRQHEYCSTAKTPLWLDVPSASQELESAL
jgi:hypothetical protein